MKRILVAIILCAPYAQAKDIQSNFEIRNHEQFPIFVRLIQKGFRTVDQTNNYQLSYTPSTVGQLTLVNGKSGGAIDSWASGFDWSRPTYVEIAYLKNKQFVNQVYGVPAYRTVYVAFENGQLRPQKGKGFGKFTQSGFPLVENIKPGDLVKLNQQQINDLFKSLDLESQEAIRALQQAAQAIEQKSKYEDLSIDELYKKFLDIKEDVERMRNNKKLDYDIYQKYE
jgi:hypothetical protein